MAVYKWPRKSLKFLKIPLYNQIVWFVSDEEVLKQCGDYLGMDEIVGSAGITITANNQHGDRIYLIGVFDKKLSTLVHEIFHCVDNISRDLGWNMSDARGEPAAYLAGFIFEALSEHIQTNADIGNRIGKPCSVVADTETKESN